MLLGLLSTYENSDHYCYAPVMYRILCNVRTHVPGTKVVNKGVSVVIEFPLTLSFLKGCRLFTKMLTLIDNVV